MIQFLKMLEFIFVLNNVILCIRFKTVDGRLKFLYVDFVIKLLEEQGMFFQDSHKELEELVLTCFTNKEYLESQMIFKLIIQIIHLFMLIIFQKLQSLFLA